LESSFEILPWQRKTCVRGWVVEGTGWVITLVSVESPDCFYHSISSETGQVSISVKMKKK
jgi:hypothetical protein